MKLVSTSIFFKPHEKDVLLVKLNNEYECVDEFIFIESAYTTTGEYKGLYLQDLITQPEFDYFRDKITIMSNAESFYPKEAEHHEQNNLASEFAFRGYCWNYIQSKYKDDDWIFLEDADESLDFSAPQRRDILLDTFKNSSSSIQFECLRYWWDYDNISLYEKYSPCHQVGALKERENPFAHRNNHCKQIKPNVWCSFEYSYCFAKKDNWLKCTTGAHDKYQVETLNRAYRYNTWHREERRNEYLRVPYDFFEKVELNENNSPQYVLNNIDSLRVNTIDEDYAVHRMNDFNMTYPHPLEQWGMLRGNKVNRKYHYMRRKNA